MIGGNAKRGAETRLAAHTGAAVGGTLAIFKQNLFEGIFFSWVNGAQNCRPPTVVPKDFALPNMAENWSTVLHRITTKLLRQSSAY